MHTIIDKHKQRMGEHVVNKDGMVWTTEMPKCPSEELRNKKYKAIIPDKRLDHFDFDCFGYHHA
jgi:hypothetical protein